MDQQNHEELFANRYKMLNPEQRDAVDTTEGPVMVVAGPGCGKTELLSMRVANILKTCDVYPSSVLCLTFTETAAFNMRERLKTIIGQDAYKVNICTFHGFGTQIINKYPEYFNKNANATALDDVTRLQIMEDIISDLDHDNPLRTKSPDGGYFYLYDITQKINELKTEGITPDEFKAILKDNAAFVEAANPILSNIFTARMSKKTIPLAEEALNSLISLKYAGAKFNKSLFTELKSEIIETLGIAISDATELGKTSPLSAWKKKHMTANVEKIQVLKETKYLKKMFALADFYKKYQKIILTQGYFDFTDMILDTIHAIESHPDLKANLQEQYLYTLVDEFQDTNAAQMKILSNLMDNAVNEGRPNIMVVGDDDQSVYKFQGANINNILGFSEAYKDTKIIVLNKNYRSSQEILDIVRKSILQGEDRLETRMPDMINKELNASNNSIKHGSISYETYDSRIEQYKNIAEKIKKSIKNGVLPNDICVISRKHKHLEDISKVMTAYGINVAYERKTEIFEIEPISQLLEILDFLLLMTKADVSAYDEALSNILLFDFWGLDRKTVYEISLTAYSRNDYKNQKFWLDVMLNHEDEKVVKLAQFFLDLSAKVPESSVEHIIDFITGTNELNGFQSMYRDHFFPVNEIANNELIKEEYLIFLNALTSLIKKIREHGAKDLFKTSDLIDFVNLHKKHGVTLYVSNSLKNQDNAVPIMTAHKAKGLEFDTVFVADCNEKVWAKSGRASGLKFPANVKISPDSDNSDDYLRLFYVAISRAKSNLHITRNTLADNTNKPLNELSFLTDLFSNDTVEIIQSDDSSKSMDEQISEFEDFLNFSGNKKVDVIPINKLEKSLLASRLENYQLSVTHLLNFIDVERGGPQYFLKQNLLSFPQGKMPSGAYGTAMHAAVQNVYIDGKTKRQKVSIETLKEYFTKSLQQQRMDKNDYEFFLKKGLDHLEVYFKNQHENFDFNDLIEYNFSNQASVVGKARITGKVDKMAVDSEEKTIFVTDFKTGKAINNLNEKKSKAWRYLTQLFFYKILIESSRDFGKSHTVTQGAIEFLEAIDGTTFIPTVQLTGPNADAETARLKRLITVVYDKIMNLDFPDISAYSADFKGTMAFVEDLIKK